jgi:imidazoleglycerol phosphate synthase glutamine amidotransferase subunit HisH
MTAQRSQAAVEPRVDSRGDVVAMPFHPEKGQAVGVRLAQAFVRRCGAWRPAPVSMRYA